MNVSKSVVVCGKEGDREGWQWGIYDVCTCPLEEQFENDGLLAKATFISTGLDVNTTKSI